MKRGDLDKMSGLSPRVRGSHSLRRIIPAALGSIPAGAGEPVSPAPIETLDKVYPRGCGGATITPAYIFPSVGLSPRVRGSRNPQADRGACAGSIPAGAGEP